MEYGRPINIWRLRKIYDVSFLRSLSNDELEDLCDRFENDIPSFSEGADNFGIILLAYRFGGI